jgi:hypothetical protein
MASMEASYATRFDAHRTLRRDALLDSLTIWPPSHPSLIGRNRGRLGAIDDVVMAAPIKLANNRNIGRMALRRRDYLKIPGHGKIVFADKHGCVASLARGVRQEDLIITGRCQKHVARLS